MYLCIPYSAKRWRHKTLANQQKYCIGKKTFGESPTWEIKQRFRPPDASGELGVKLWRIKVRQNIETTCKTLQRIAALQRHTLQYTLGHGTRKLPRERAVYSRLVDVSRGPQLFWITSTTTGITWNHRWNQRIKSRFWNLESYFVYIILEYLVLFRILWITQCASPYLVSRNH